MISENELNFYKKYGIRTKINSMEFVLFSDNIKEIVEYIQNSLIHIGEIKFRGLNLSSERSDELNNKNVQDILRKFKELHRDIDSDGNIKKVIGICRHFSMFLASVLKSKGIPSRCRCGFATYFKKIGLKIIGFANIGITRNVNGLKLMHN